MLNPASMNGMVLMTPTGRVVLQWRDREMGIARSVDSGKNSVTLPYWVRLTRKGNQLIPQHSSEGVQWDAFVDPQDPNKPAPIEIPMREAVPIGLAISSHNATRAAEARISNVIVNGSVTSSDPLIYSKDICLQIFPGNSTNK